MDPHSWWVIHGASTPILQTLALKILTQPSSLHVVREIGVLLHPFIEKEQNDPSIGGELGVYL